MADVVPNEIGSKEIPTAGGSLLGKDPCGGWTLRERLIILSMAVSKGCGFAALSVIAPLFPASAEKHGVSTTVTGFVFSSYALAAALSAPLSGMAASSLGLRILIVGSLAIAAMATIVFGVRNTNGFVAGAFILRASLGVFFGACMTGMFAAVTILFGEGRMGQALSWLQMSISIGVSVGPPMGSALFRTGGFVVPFVVLGAVTLVAASPLAFLLPPKQETDQMDLEASKEVVEREDSPILPRAGPSFWRLFAVWEAVLALITIFVDALALIYFTPILQPFLQQEFGLMEKDAGFVFLACMASNALIMPVSGKLADRFPDYKYAQMIAGFVLGSLGSLLLGPAPFLRNFLPVRSMATTVIALIMVGVGYPFVMLPSYHAFVSGITCAGFSSDLRTFGKTSALWQSIFFLGEAAGSAMAAGAADFFGNFVMSFVSLAILTSIMALILLGHVVLTRRQWTR